MNLIEKEILDQFPRYKKGDVFVGTREYWEGVFSLESNRNPELHKAFCELHKRIVNEVIRFCQKNDLTVDEFSVHADGLLDSKPYGEWTCYTDSSMALYGVKEDEDGHMYPDREIPFLFEA